MRIPKSPAPAHPVRRHGMKLFGFAEGGRLGGNEGGVLMRGMMQRDNGLRESFLGVRRTATTNRIT